MNTSILERTYAAVAETECGSLSVMHTSIRGNTQRFGKDVIAVRPAIMKMKVTELYDILYRKMGDLQWWPAETPDEVVIGAVLTQNTSWSNVEKALFSLRCAGMLTIRALSCTNAERLGMLIKSSGFYNQKSERLIELSCRIRKTYGNLEKMAEDTDENVVRFLRPIKGIGQETLDSILLYALNKPVFIADKYSIRIFYRTGVLSGKPDLEEIRSVTMRQFGNDLSKLKNFHAMLVQLAKDYCRKKPVCEGCPVRIDCRYYTEVMFP